MFSGVIRMTTYATLSCFVASPCQAQNTGTEVWHIVTDPLGLGRSSENIAASIQAISEIEAQVYAHTTALEKQTNQDVVKDLELFGNLEQQINKDIASRSGQIDLILKSRIDQLQLLEGKVYSDTADLIRCSAVNVADEAKSALADALNQISEAQPTVYFLWVFPIAKVHVEPQSVGDPIEAWRTLEKEYVELLNSLTDESDANIIPSTYAKMMIATDRVLCVVKNQQSTASDIQMELAKVEARARLWVGWTDWINWQGSK